MARFEYTDHAEEKLNERKLDKELVESVVLSPEKVMETVFDRKIAQRQIGGKLLRVVYEEKYGVYIIITAYYAQKERYS